MVERGRSPTSLPLQEDKEGGLQAENAENKVGGLKDKETPSAEKVDAKIRR